MFFIPDEAVGPGEDGGRVQGAGGEAVAQLVPVVSQVSSKEIKIYRPRQMLNLDFYD